MSFPSPDDLADIDGVDAGIKAFVPFLGRIVAEILFRLVPNRHGFAFDDQAGLLVIRRAMLGIGYMQAEGGGFVAVATAVAAHILPHFRVIELHDGEARILLHKLPSVTTWCHVNGHCRTVVAKVVADTAPTDGHGVALRGVATTNEEVLGEPGEAVF